MPDFAGSNTSLQDAYARPRSTSINGRISKFKAPVGLERLQSATALMFPERGLPTNLVPEPRSRRAAARRARRGLFEYQAGVFNGTPDGGSVNNDVDDSKEFAGRVWFRPLKSLGSTFAELGRFAGPTERGGETSANSQVASYNVGPAKLSPGATVIADNAVPSAPRVLSGPGVLAEHVARRRTAIRGTTRRSTTTPGRSPARGRDRGGELPRSMAWPTT
jgi:phosphate-selective porin OprO/OprP